MIFKHILAAAIVMASFSAQAAIDRCDLKNLHFGINQVQLKSEFKFDALDVASDGEANIRLVAADICKDLPEAAVVEFLLIDDKFVQMKISYKTESDQLYTYATSTFGERDNKEKDPEKATKNNDKVRLGLWGQNDAYKVIYATYKKGADNTEELDITSNKHKEAFSKANEQKARDIDAYLKEKKLGKYSPNYKDKEDVGSAGLPKPKEADKSNVKDPVLKENEHGRGWHYE